MPDKKNNGKLEKCPENDVDICPMLDAMEVLGGKWKILIIYYLSSGTLRFGELRKELPGITQKMLTQQLRELERDGLVNRKVYAEVPPRVEYSLTELAKALYPVFEGLQQWGLELQKHAK